MTETLAMFIALYLVCCGAYAHKAALTGIGKKFALALAAIEGGVKL